MTDVVLRDYVSGEDDVALEALWERCFGAARGGQSLPWLFRPGPAGPCPRSVAEVGGRIVAHAGGVPLRFRIEGRRGVGAYSVGAMTDPDHRGRGLFVRTARHLYDRLQRDGFAFVAGFSNAHSAGLHTGALGRTAIRPFPWSVKPLRPVGALGALVTERLGRGASGPQPRLGELSSPSAAGPLRAVPAAVGDPRVDAVWRRARSALAVGAVRDADYARWRYGGRPDAGYRACLVLKGEAPVAWAVARSLRLRGLHGVFVLDLLADPAVPGAAVAALSAVESAARAAGAHLVSTLRPGAGPLRRTLLRRGHLPVPERLHPQTIRLSVRGFGDFADHDALVTPARWWLSWADTDVV